MKIQLKKLNKTVKAGFSLVELLVVIAVIGIMAAIAVPMISNVNQKSKDAKDRRNAQSIASMAAAAIAAGVTFSSEDDAVTQLTSSTGVEGPTGSAFAGTVFRVPNLSATDTTSAKNYLEYSSGNLVYNQNQ